MEMFVRRMFTDTAFKESSPRNPKTAMAGYRLSSAEKMAVSRKCQVSDRTGASGGGGLGATGGLGG